MIWNGQHKGKTNVSRGPASLNTCTTKSNGTDNNILATLFLPTRERWPQCFVLHPQIGISPISGSTKSFHNTLRLGHFTRSHSHQSIQSPTKDALTTQSRRGWDRETPLFGRVQTRHCFARHTLNSRLHYHISYILTCTKLSVIHVNKLCLSHKFVLSTHLPRNWPDLETFAILFSTQSSSSSFCTVYVLNPFSYTKKSDLLICFVPTAYQRSVCYALKAALLHPRTLAICGLWHTKIQ